MPTPVEIVRTICKNKKIAVAKLEQDLEFGNGYLNPKKIDTIPLDRATKIADYLGVSISDFVPGSEKDPAAEAAEPLDAEFIEIFNKLTESEKKLVRAQILGILQNRE